MKSPKRNNSGNCLLHHDKFQFICLHNNCQNCFKLLCQKCKKQKHYQHPNRVLQLSEFFEMVHKNHLNFVQNSLCMELINLKNKIIHVSNFRAFILQKQADLMENTKDINHHLLKILKQKQQLSCCMENLCQQNQQNHTQVLASSVEKLQKFIVYNPINGILTISSDKIKVMKNQLQKCFQSTVTVINDLREYLIKIIEVLLSQEIQQDQIDYFQEEDVDNKTFNIQIKKPTSMQTNQKQPKYRIQQIFSLFSKLLKQEFNISEQLQNDVKLLEEQIRVKTEIVNNIRKRSYSNQPKQFMNDVDSIKQKQLKSQSKSKMSQKHQTASNNVNIKLSPKSNINQKTPKAVKIRSITQAKNQSSNRNIQTPKSPKNNIISPKANRNNNAYQKQNSRVNKQQQNIQIMSPNIKKQLPKQIKQQSFQQNQSSNQSFILRQKINTLQKQINNLRKELSQTLHLVQNYRITFNDDKLDIEERIKNFKAQPATELKVQSFSSDKQVLRLKKKVQDLKLIDKKSNQEKQKLLKQVKSMQQKMHKAQEKASRLQSQLKKQKLQTGKQKKTLQQKMKQMQKNFQLSIKQKQQIKSQKEQLTKQISKTKIQLQKLDDKLKQKDHKVEELHKQCLSTKQQEQKTKEQLKIKIKQLNQNLAQIDHLKKQKSSIEQKVQSSESNKAWQNYKQQLLLLGQVYQDLKQKYQLLNQSYNILKQKQIEQEETVRNQLKNNQVIVDQQILLEQYNLKIKDLEEEIKQLKQNNQAFCNQKTKVQTFQLQVKQKLIQKQMETQKLKTQFKQKQQNFIKKQNFLRNQCKDIHDKYEQLKAVQQRKIQQKTLAQKAQTSKNQITIPMLNIKSSQSQIDMSNYVQIRKFKQTRQMLQISIRKNNTLKFTLDQLTQQIQKLRQQNSVLNQSRQSHHCSSKLQVNQSKMQNQPSHDYKQVKNLVNALTSDFTLLQDKIKQNAIIQKVYLKQLDRKRTQNRKLRQYIEELTSKQRQYLGIQTDRNFQKLNQRQQNQYKIHLATGFAGSGSRVSSSHSNSTMSGINFQGK